MSLSPVGLIERHFLLFSKDNSASDNSRSMGNPRNRGSIALSRFFEASSLASRLVLLAFLFLLFLPTDPFEGERVWKINEIGEKEARWIHESFSIYAALKANRVDLSDSSIWDMARTILHESVKHSLDSMLVLALIKVESSFRHNAVSMHQAQGLMQVRPVVADALGKEIELGRGESIKKIHDSVVNIKLGVSYLAYLQERFRNLKLALTAYNWGPTRVQMQIASGEPLPLEYARRVLSTYRLYQEQDWQTEKVLPDSQPKSGMGDPPRASF